MLSLEWLRWRDDASMDNLQWKCVRVSNPHDVVCCVWSECDSRSRHCAPERKRKTQTSNNEGRSIESEDRSRATDPQYQVEVKINAPI